MTSFLREQLRYHLLLQAEAASALGLTDDAYLWSARIQGYPVGPAAIAAELLYLADKGFLTPTNKVLSPELPRRRITAAGRDLLASFPSA